MEQHYKSNCFAWIQIHCEGVLANLQFKHANTVNLKDEHGKYG